MDTDNGKGFWVTAKGLKAKVHAEALRARRKAEATAEATALTRIHTDRGWDNDRIKAKDKGLKAKAFGHRLVLSILTSLMTTRRSINTDGH